MTWGILLIPWLNLAKGLTNLLLMATFLRHAAERMTRIFVVRLKYVSNLFSLVCNWSYAANHLSRVNALMDTKVRNPELTHRVENHLRVFLFCFGGREGFVKPNNQKISWICWTWFVVQATDYARKSHSGVDLCVFSKTFGFRSLVTPRMASW